ncbi:MAG: roadblock/LC7 domain-containing protein [Candidatus Helarchaeota archaeon]
MISEKPLQKFLNELKINSGISRSILITEDGLLITRDDENSNSNDLMQNMEIGAITAGILSMSERLVDLLTKQKLNQILIKTELDSEENGLTTIITLVYNNIILLVFFPSKLNVGLILFEIEETKQKISDYLKNQKGDFILNPESVL